MQQTIAILGAGFGGLRAAMLLGKALRRHKLTDWRVALVDRNDYHTYAPLLYEVSATPEEVATYFDLKSIVTFPLRQVLGGLAVELVCDTVSGLDLPHGKVALASGSSLDYDYLIIALGAEARYYGIAGLQEAALGLKTFDDAMRIRDAIWLSSCAVKKLIIVIGGGGSTGVELAGELQPWLNEITRAGRCSTGITLLHAGASVLSGFPQRVVEKVAARLGGLKVKILTNERIVAVESGAHAVRLESGMQIPFDILIWTAGVKPNSILGKLPVQYESNGRLAVAEDLSLLADGGTRLHGKVYGVGDAVYVGSTSGDQAVPMTARSAIAQASLAARNVIADIQGKPSIAYKPRNYPYIIPVGGKYAVAKIGPLVVAGFPAWLFKGGVELGYLLAILPPLHALRVWFKGIKLFTLNDRLG
ncbi:MAG: NAD(P)/FAD-dependent oxidoreductase [Burkholderiales bacterium]|nr:NAD(P)/FAD-dependent oxidoreductase [Burkholderiales bacterium]